MSETHHSGKPGRLQQTVDGVPQSPMEGDSPASVERWQMGVSSAAPAAKQRSRRRPQQSFVTAPSVGLFRSNSGGVIRCSSGGAGDAVSSNSSSRRRVRQLEERTLPPSYSATTAVRSLGASLSAASRMSTQSASLSRSVASAFTTPSPSAGLDQRLARLNNGADSDNSGETSSESSTSPTKKNKSSDSAVDMDTTPSTGTLRRNALINQLTVTLSETYAQHAPPRWSADGQASESATASSAWGGAPPGTTPRSAGKKRVSPGADDTGLYQQSPQRRAIFPPSALEQGAPADAIMGPRAVPSRNRLSAVAQQHHPPRHPPLVTHMEDQRVASMSDAVNAENHGEDDEGPNGGGGEKKAQRLSALVQEQQFSFDDDNMMEASPQKDRRGGAASGVGTKQETQRRQQPNSLLHTALQKQENTTSKSKNHVHNNGLETASSAPTAKPKPPLTSAPAPSGLSEAFAVADAAAAAAAAAAAETAVNPPSATQEPINTNTDCLTLPSTPDLNSNNGLDNTEGNLIVHRNDVFRIPTHEIYDVSSGSNSPTSGRTSSTRNGAVNLQRSSWAANLNSGQATTDFRVLDLLGQGTFAQVFKCHIVGTNRSVAVKIVKNKPAYTRQAAVEIDIFRSLMEETGKGSEARQSQGVSTGVDGSINNVAVSGCGRDHMVKLLAFFLHRQHLCLVFELLGLNLYEVLKRRQFRGLPLKTVREILRQALEAMKDLSQKSIVHCDLKPENMLMVSADFSPEEDSSAKPPSNRGGNRSALASRRSKPAPPTSTADSDFSDRRIKIIDFGSACFEGKTAHTYIQSRFYRSPEVLVGLDYDSAIDMWSLGCVGAELFLGLPILPGVHEHDQLSRICEMIGTIPDWMLQQGSKSTKYFVKYIHKPDVSELNNLGRALPRGGGIGAAIAGMTAGGAPPRTPSPGAVSSGTSPPPPRVAWRLKTRDEFIATLSEDERLRRGGLSKLEQQPTNRYFRRKQLEDIVMLHGSSGMEEDKADMELFVHFLKGVLDPDPWKRWTALQASMHPFITGSRDHQRRTNNLASELVGTGRASTIHWAPPLDTTVYRRQLNSVQRIRDKKKAQGQMRSSRSQDSAVGVDRQVRTQNNTPSEITKTANYLGPGHEYYAPLQPGEQPVEVAGASRLAAVADAVHNVPQVLLPQTHPYGRMTAATSPPTTLGGVMASRARPQSDLAMHQHLSASYGAVLGGDAALAYAAAAATPPHHLHLGGAGVDHSGQLHGMVMDGGYNSSALLSPAVGGPAAFNDPRYGAQRQLPLSTGPQSFSGFQYDGFGDERFHVEGDFGYALQRPGVVPMGGDPNALQELHGLSLALLSQHLPAAQASLNPLIRSGSFASQASLGGQIPSSPHATPAGRNSAMSYTMGGTPSHLLPSSPLMYPLLRQDQMMASPAGHALPNTVDIGAGGGLAASGAGLTTATNFVARAPRPSLLAQQLAAHSSSSLQTAADVDARAAAAAHLQHVNAQNELEAQRGLLRSSLEQAAIAANGSLPVGSFAYGQIPAPGGAQQIFIGGGGGGGGGNIDPMLISSPSGPLLHAQGALGGGGGGGMGLPRQAFHAPAYTRGQSFHGLSQVHLTEQGPLHVGGGGGGMSSYPHSYTGLSHLEPPPPHTHMPAHAAAAALHQHAAAAAAAIYPPPPGPEARPSSYR